MLVIETTVFSRLIQELMSDDEYPKLQEALVTRPKGIGGLRKIRWKLEGGGKRGGIRVIYYWAVSADQVRMLYAYKKSRQTDLSPDQIAVLKAIVERWSDE